MSDRTIPLSVTLKYTIAICAGVWLLTFLFPIYVGLVALIGAVLCSILWLVNKVRQAFAYAERDLADFVAGKTARRKPVENPLMGDPFYRSLATQIEEAKAKHKRVNHLYAKRDLRVRELLGTKGAAQ